MRETTGTAVSFSQWMSWGVPIVAIMVPLVAVGLARKVPRDLVVNLPDIGAWRSGEKRVLIIFGLTALAWMTRTEPFGGWREWLGMSTANDAAVAFCAVVALFYNAGQRGRAAYYLGASERYSVGCIAPICGRYNARERLCCVGT